MEDPWTEEAGYGVIAERLNTDSFDLFGSTVWQRQNAFKLPFSLPL